VVIGTEYVGLVTGIYLAETGSEFICVDIDTEKVEKNQNRILPIYEPQLDVLFDLNIKAEGVTCLSVERKEVNI
jgi:UDPglucose 6-dehydrogenase